jgi:hypothetical protein
MYININSYLNHLKAIESTKPENERRSVPTLTELAELAEVHQTTLSRIAGNKVGELNLKVFDVTITELRRRGFSADVSDLLVYIPPSS